VKRVVHLGLRGGVAAALVAAVAAGTFVARPLPDGLLDRRPVTSVRFTDRDGGLLRELRSREDGRSVPLAGGEIPPLVREAFLAAEDQRFGRHPGVDPLAVARAVVQNLRAGRIVSGASTIPQQLARRLVPRERTWLGKLGEALWALRLTAHLDDERILLEYLDRVPLGNSIHGVEAAAETYFGRPAARLSVGQAALLAGMTRAPAVYDPYRWPERARARMRSVLALMAENGALDPDEARRAGEAPLDLVPRETAFRAPHLVASLARSLEDLGLGAAVTVETTLDPALQADLEAAVREEVAGLAGKDATAAAALVVDNRTGEVLAYVGSAGFFDEASGGQNDGVRALRQPGSALKPFAYGLALASGFTPATVLSDVETRLATPGGAWVPRNYDRRVHGPVRLRAALASSYNIPAVRLADRLGPDRILATLRRAGFASLTEDARHYGVGLVLGNGDVSLYELARAYRGLARGGVVGPLTTIRRAEDAAGYGLPVPRELGEQRFLPEEAVALLTDILADEAARAPAFGLDNALRLPFPVAAKTGTSRAHVDNWAVGFTRERTVAVWVGNFDGRAMRGVSGITGAGPLFRRAMLLAMRGVEPTPLVDRSRFEEVAICPLSGGRAGPSCPGALHERFLPGTGPGEECPVHGPGGDLVLGPEFSSWARAEGLASDAGARGPATALGLPGDGDEYALEPGIPAEAQEIPVRAVARHGVEALEWRLDGGERVPLPVPFVGRVAASPGFHRLELYEAGATEPAAVARFRVLGEQAEPGTGAGGH
jgi:penicillin-binding protein 1C